MKINFFSVESYQGKSEFLITHKDQCASQALWCMPVITALGMWAKLDQKFKVSLSYPTSPRRVWIIRLWCKQNQKQINKWNNSSNNNKRTILPCRDTYFWVNCQGQSSTVDFLIHTNGCWMKGRHSLAKGPKLEKQGSSDSQFSLIHVVLLFHV